MKTTPNQTIQNHTTKKHHQRRWPWIVLVVFLLLSAVSTYVVGDYFVNYGLVPNQGAETREIKEEDVKELPSENQQKIDQNNALMKKNRDEWLKKIAPQTEAVTIQSEEGFNLSGHIYKQPATNHRWMVIVHGYQTDEMRSQIIAPIFYDHGYNVLTMNLRAMAPSEGDYITMGNKEADDIRRWTDFIVERDPEAEIIYHGTSMGAATVMNAAGPGVSDHVKAVIEDCGYSSTWDIFGSELKKRFNLPTFPILNMASVMAKYRAGIWFKERAPIDAVRETTVPMLFIHGDEDDFVPVEMAYELYDAYPGTAKELKIIHGAGHDDNKFLDPKDYFDTIFAFIEKYAK